MNDKLITTRYLHLHYRNTAQRPLHTWCLLLSRWLHRTLILMLHITLCCLHLLCGDHCPVCVPAPWRPHVTLALVTVTLLTTDLSVGLQLAMPPPARIQPLEDKIGPPLALPGHVLLQQESSPDNKADIQSHTCLLLLYMITDSLCSVIIIWP